MHWNWVVGFTNGQRKTTWGQIVAPAGVIDTWLNPKQVWHGVPSWHCSWDEKSAIQRHTYIYTTSQHVIRRRNKHAKWWIERHKQIKLIIVIVVVNVPVICSTKITSLSRVKLILTACAQLSNWKVKHMLPIQPREGIQALLKSMHWFTTLAVYVIVNKKKKHAATNSNKQQTNNDDDVNETMIFISWLDGGVDHITSVSIFWGTRTSGTIQFHVLCIDWLKWENLDWRARVNIMEASMRVGNWVRVNHTYWTSLPTLTQYKCYWESKATYWAYRRFAWLLCVWI